MQDIDLNEAVFTTTFIMNDRMPVLHVFHDLSDNYWQFLGNQPADMKDAMIVCFGEILDTDPTLRDILHLEAGFKASRIEVGGAWEIEELIEEEED